MLYTTKNTAQLHHSPQFLNLYLAELIELLRVLSAFAIDKYHNLHGEMANISSSFP